MQIHNTGGGCSHTCITAPVYVHYRRGSARHAELCFLNHDKNAWGQQHNVKYVLVRYGVHEVSETLTAVPPSRNLQLLRAHALTQCSALIARNNCTHGTKKCYASIYIVGQPNIWLAELALERSCEGTITCSHVSFVK